MKALSSQFVVRRLHGFAVHVLNNNEIELAVVPELGAKIISLKNLRTGREWLWHPPEGLKLFKNQVRDDFSIISPLVGIDECFPTIEPCFWQGREAARPRRDLERAGRWMVTHGTDGVLKTKTRLSRFRHLNSSAPLNCRDNEVRIAYRLHNLKCERGKLYLWAMTPPLRRGGRRPNWNCRIQTRDTYERRSRGWMTVDLG